MGNQSGPAVGIPLRRRPFLARATWHVVFIALVCNAADAVLTVVWVQNGIAEEANVLLRGLVNDHPLLFVALKLVLVPCGLFLLWRLRRHSLALVGLYAIFAVYGAVFLRHLVLTVHLA